MGLGFDQVGGKVSKMCTLQATDLREMLKLGVLGPVGGAAHSWVEGRPPTGSGGCEAPFLVPWGTETRAATAAQGLCRQPLMVVGSPQRQ